MSLIVELDISVPLMFLGLQIEDNSSEVAAVDVTGESCAKFKICSSNEELNVRKLSVGRIFNESFSSGKASGTTVTCALVKEKHIDELTLLETADEGDAAAFMLQIDHIEKIMEQIHGNAKALTLDEVFEELFTQLNSQTNQVCSVWQINNNSVESNVCTNCPSFIKVMRQIQANSVYRLGIIDGQHRCFMYIAQFLEISQLLKNGSAKSGFQYSYHNSEKVKAKAKQNIFNETLVNVRIVVAELGNTNLDAFFAMCKSTSKQITSQYTSAMYLEPVHRIYEAMMAVYNRISLRSGELNEIYAHINETFIQMYKNDNKQNWRGLSRGKRRCIFQSLMKWRRVRCESIFPSFFADEREAEKTFQWNVAVRSEGCFLTGLYKWIYVSRNGKKKQLWKEGSRQQWKDENDFPLICFIEECCPTERLIQQYAELFENCYQALHAESSKQHNISHTDIWTLNSMIQVTEFHINLTKFITSKEVIKSTLESNVYNTASGNCHSMSHIKVSNVGDSNVLISVIQERMKIIAMPFISELVLDFLNNIGLFPFDERLPWQLTETEKDLKWNSLHRLSIMAFLNTLWEDASNMHVQGWSYALKNTVGKSGLMLVVPSLFSGNPVNICDIFYDIQLHKGALTQAYVAFTSSGTYLTLAGQFFGNNIGIANTLELPHVSVDQLLVSQKIPSQGAEVSDKEVHCAMGNVIDDHEEGQHTIFLSDSNNEVSHEKTICTIDMVNNNEVEINHNIERRTSSRKRIGGRKDLQQEVSEAKFDNILSKRRAVKKKCSKSLQSDKEYSDRVRSGTIYGDLTLLNLIDISTVLSVEDRGCLNSYLKKEYQYMSSEFSTYDNNKFTLTDRVENWPSGLLCIYSTIRSICFHSCYVYETYGLTCGSKQSNKIIYEMPVDHERFEFVATWLYGTDGVTCVDTNQANVKLDTNTLLIFKDNKFDVFWRERGLFLLCGVIFRKRVSDVHLYIPYQYYNTYILTSYASISTCNGLATPDSNIVYQLLDRNGISIHLSKNSQHPDMPRVVTFLTNIFCKKPDVQIIKYFLSKNWESCIHWAFIVNNSSGEIIGASIYNVNPEGTYICYMAVDEKWIRKGLGSLLLYTVQTVSIWSCQSKKLYIMTAKFSDAEGFYIRKKFCKSKFSDWPHDIKHFAEVICMADVKDWKCYVLKQNINIK